MKLITLAISVSSRAPAPALHRHHRSCSTDNTLPRRFVRLSTRGRFAIRASASLELELPLLPFPKDQVLVPSEAKKLHLYEARYLALLEESLYKKKNMFVHFVLDPIAVNDTFTEASFAARYACLVAIEKVDRLAVGALVFIRGIGRVKIIRFEQEEPFLRGSVIPTKDSESSSEEELNSKVLELQEALLNLNSLEIKLKAPEEALLQTQTANSLKWAEKTPALDCDEAFVPRLSERISFAALQPVSGSTQSELLKLNMQKLSAMESKDTLQRLEKSVELVKINISVVAAKLALQSIKIQ